MTNEDHQALRGMLAELGAHLTERIAESETRLTGHIDERIPELETRLAERIAESEARSQEFSRGLETKLLAAFHDYARGQLATIHRLQVSDADIVERLSALESRVLNLETRRNPQ